MYTLIVSTRDPQHLKTLHPGLKHIPELPEDCDEFLALAAGVKSAGFIRPVLIDEHDRVIDDHGRNLVRVARRWQMTEVPVKICKGDDAAMLRVHSLKDVRHLSVGAQIYLCVDDALEIIEKSKRDVVAWHKNRPQVGLQPEVLTQADVCELFKWNKRMFERAIEVKEIFKDPKKYFWNVKGGKQDGAVVECTAKEWFEPRLMKAFVGGEHEDARPLGLGGIIAGYETRRKNPDSDAFNPKGSPLQLDFFTDMFTKDARKFIALAANKRDAAIKAVAEIAEGTPPEECEQIAVVYKTMAKIYADAAKAKA